MSKENKSKSSQLIRIAVLLGIFAVAALGILAYQSYLKNSMPKKDMDFVKKGKKDDPEEDGLTILRGMLKGDKESKEVTQLKEKSSSEVEYTYDEISSMSASELNTKMEELSKKLLAVRSKLPPSIGGASAGGAADAGGSKETSPIEALALPLEVMRQVAEANK